MTTFSRNPFAFGAGNLDSGGFCKTEREVSKEAETKGLAQQGRDDISKRIAETGCEAPVRGGLGRTRVPVQPPPVHSLLNLIMPAPLLKSWHFSSVSV